MAKRITRKEQEQSDPETEAKAEEATPLEALQEPSGEIGAEPVAPPSCVSTLQLLDEVRNEQTQDAPVVPSALLKKGPRVVNNGSMTVRYN